MHVVLLTVGCLMIAATAIAWLRTDAWWVRIFDFPRAQIAVTSIVVLLAFGLTTEPFSRTDQLFLLSLGVSTLFQGAMMYPYLPFAKKQVQASQNPRPASSLNLLTANVLMTNRQAGRLLQLVRQADPDIILTVETDAWWQVQLSELQQTHPYTVQQAQDNTYGMLLFSRLELIDAQVKFLIQDDVPSIHASVRLRSGQQVSLHCLHPRPPFPTEDERSTERDAELLLVGKAIKAKDLPVVVMGDLNDVAWSRTNGLFQDISGLLDPRIGRGFFNTFHAQIPFLRFPLDHFFHSNHFRLIRFQRLADFGSDHFPVFVSLSYEPDAQGEQPELQASRGEQQEADEKIDKAA